MEDIIEMNTKNFVVPFLILGLPIFDTTFAFFRRLAHGQSPMQADRGHIHHRLIDMGLNQKQAVATLYVISAILGLSAVVLTTGGEQRAMLLFAALCIAGAIAARLVFPQEIRAELKNEIGDWREHHNNAPPKPSAQDNAQLSGKPDTSPAGTGKPSKRHHGRRRKNRKKSV